MSHEKTSEVLNTSEVWFLALVFIDLLRSVLLIHTIILR
jgi:hypothetical protein